MALTAGALGMQPLINSLDAVSERDFALDLLYACAVIGVHLSRLGEEWVIWTSQEFGFVTLELKAGKRRVEALRNLGERTGVDDLKKLTAVLIQADRFGTGVAQSLETSEHGVAVIQMVLRDPAPDLLFVWVELGRPSGTRLGKRCPTQILANGVTR